MVGVLKEFQKQQREQSQEIRLIERNSALATPGSFKAALLTQVRLASISPRMALAEESQDPNTAAPEADKKGDIQMRRATLKLQRINLAQLKAFLQGLEYGQYSLDVSNKN